MHMPIVYEDYELHRKHNESQIHRFEHEDYEFHRKALVTQRAAEELAHRFNDEAAELGLAGLPKARPRPFLSVTIRYYP